MGGGKGEGDFFHNLIHPSPLSSPTRGEDFILLQFKICVQVSDQIIDLRRFLGRIKLMVAVSYFLLQ
jgi:hypothetical protein